VRQAGQPGLIDLWRATANETEPQADVGVDPDGAPAIAVTGGLFPREGKAFLPAQLIDHDNLQVGEGTVINLEFGSLTVENEESHVRISFQDRAHQYRSVVPEATAVMPNQSLVKDRCVWLRRS
jgi:hypothetical protein